MKFADLPISPKTLSGLESSGFINMTDIQKQSILPCLRGSDVQVFITQFFMMHPCFLLPLFYHKTVSRNQVLLRNKNKQRWCVVHNHHNLATTEYIPDGIVKKYIRHDRPIRDFPNQSLLIGRLSKTEYLFQAEAMTGSGKTLGFLVPLLECLWREKWSQNMGVGALVITPTRELAYQIYEVLKKV